MVKIAIVCVITIIIFWTMLSSRSQALQRFAVLELALALAVSGSAALGYMCTVRFVKEQYPDLYGNCDGQMETALAGLRTDLARSGGLLFLVATLLLALVIYLQGRQVRSMIRRITKVATGKAQWDGETIRRGLFGDSNEMRALRNSLTQLMNGNDQANYTQYQMLQAYYRFAPKKIETILKKPSILDVEAADRIRTDGTIAIVSAAVSEKPDLQEASRYLNENYQVMSRARDAEGGIFLCGNADLSEMYSLFPDEAKHALQFGIDVAAEREHVRAGEQTFVLLHHTNLTYGVAGDERQASTYLISNEMKMLENYTNQLRAMGIRMAVTDSVYELIGEDTAVRYIGFVERGKYSFKLYEILDAYPAKERQKRLEAKSKFQEAMNLFYQDDFYLARSLFTEVLKENPGDEVAKWYVFICEKYLDQGAAGDISYGLFSGE